MILMREVIPSLLQLGLNVMVAQCGHAGFSGNVFF
jgi:hypothetical protein